ncbi:MAG: TrmH family RNA methyltransferase [Gammaproteobacteria bacterium]|jgi:tRNA (cytidine/uridine-2'-O-)-methyltransferase
MRIALIQPEIPQNVGSVIRLAACLDVNVDLIGPLGFVLTDKKLRRAGMDYIDLAKIRRFDSLENFISMMTGRLILFTTKGDIGAYSFTYKEGDVLAFGSETSGAPALAHSSAAARLALPMTEGARSMNLATAAALALGEGLRQIGGLPQ